MKFFYAKKAFLFILLGTVLMCAGCSKNYVDSIPPPENGKSSLVGFLIDKKGTPLGNTIVRLAEVYRADDNSEEGAYILDTAFSPGAITDEKGFFMIQNIEPAEYVIVVGDIENNNYEIISQENGRPKVWSTIKDEVLDVGKLIVSNYRN